MLPFQDVTFYYHKLHLENVRRHLQQKELHVGGPGKTALRFVFVVVFAAADTRTDLIVHPEEEAGSPAEAPVITLGSLETKSCVDELSDGVQSMDVR